MATGNLVNLEKSAETSRIKNEFLAQNKAFDNFSRKLKKFTIKFSIEGPILLFFVNLSQIFSEGLSVTTINKSRSFSYT